MAFSSKSSGDIITFLNACKCELSSGTMSTVAWLLGLMETPSRAHRLLKEVCREMKDSMKKAP